MIPHEEGIWHPKYEQNHSQSEISQLQPWSSQIPLQKTLGTLQPREMWKKYVMLNFLKGKENANKKEKQPLTTYNDNFIVNDKTASIFSRFYLSRSRTTLFLQILNNTIGLTRTFVLFNRFPSISQNLKSWEAPNLKFWCKLFVCIIIGINFGKNNWRVMTTQYRSSLLILQIREQTCTCQRTENIILNNYPNVRRKSNLSNRNEKILITSGAIFLQWPHL